jgi:hypothetical protein
MARGARTALARRAFHPAQEVPELAVPQVVYTQNLYEFTHGGLLPRLELRAPSSLRAATPTGSNVEGAFGRWQFATAAVQQRALGERAAAFSRDGRRARLLLTRRTRLQVAATQGMSLAERGGRR